MRIAQIVVAGASAYEKKVQQIDFRALTGLNDVVVLEPRDLRFQRIDVAHVYGPPDAQRSDFVDFRVPYVAPSSPRRRRLEIRRPTDPARIATPLRDSAGEYVPEAVDDSYFGARRERSGLPIVGSFGRADLAGMVERTVARLHRFRDDIEWRVFDAPPSPVEIAAVGTWVDPAIADDDYDGFVAEAIAAGVTVVAARTPINAQRLEKGRTGFLVPPEDPNELTHAILAALFKPEAAREREIAARQTASKFRVRQRLRALLALYESLTG